MTPPPDIPRRTSSTALGSIMMLASDGLHGAEGMGNPDLPEQNTTIQLSAALAGGAEARGRQLTLLRAVVATVDAVTAVHQDGDALRVTFDDARAAALC